MFNVVNQRIATTVGYQFTCIWIAIRKNMKITSVGKDGKTTAETNQNLPMLSLMTHYPVTLENNWFGSSSKCKHGVTICLGISVYRGTQRHENLYTNVYS